MSPLETNYANNKKFLAFIFSTTRSKLKMQPSSNKKYLYKHRFSKVFKIMQCMHRMRILYEQTTRQPGRAHAVPMPSKTTHSCVTRAEDFSGYSFCACSLILHPICLSPGMRFVIYCELCILDWWIFACKIGVSRCKVGQF